MSGIEPSDDFGQVQIYTLINTDQNFNNKSITTMTLDIDDINAIVNGVLAGLASGNDQIKVDQAKIILGVRERQLNNLVKTYPELKPAGKGSHYFSRTACIRVANLKNA